MAGNLVPRAGAEVNCLPMLSKTQYDDALLKAHRLHDGVYRRVAEKLGIDPSYVSLVAAGKRQEATIRRALVDELRTIQRLLE
jgi:hypothetical protein